MTGELRAFGEWLRARRGLTRVLTQGHCAPVSRRKECVRVGCRHYSPRHAADVLSRRAVPPALARPVDVPAAGALAVDSGGRVDAPPTDRCQCGHPRGEHEDPRNGDEVYCLLDECDCSGFEVVADRGASDPCQCGHPREDHTSNRFGPTACMEADCPCAAFDGGDGPAEQPRRCCSRHAATQVLSSNRGLVLPGAEVLLSLYSMVPFAPEYAVLHADRAACLVRSLRVGCDEVVLYTGAEGLPGECFSPERPLLVDCDPVAVGQQVTIRVQNLAAHSFYAQLALHGRRCGRREDRGSASGRYFGGRFDSYDVPSTYPWRFR